MGLGTTESDAKESVNMDSEVEVVDVRVGGQCIKSPFSHDVAEELVLRQIYMDGDCDPVEDANFAEMKAEASLKSMKQLRVSLLEGRIRMLTTMTITTVVMCRWMTLRTSRRVIIMTRKSIFWMIPWKI